MHCRSTLQMTKEYSTSTKKVKHLHPSRNPSSSNTVSNGSARSITAALHTCTQCSRYSSAFENIICKNLLLFQMHKDRPLPRLHSAYNLRASTLSTKQTSLSQTPNLQICDSPCSTDLPWNSLGAWGQFDCPLRPLFLYPYY